MKTLIIAAGPALVCLGIDTRTATAPPPVLAVIETLPICLAILLVLMLLLRLLRR